MFLSRIGPLTRQRYPARHTLADRSELLDPAQGYTPLLIYLSSSNTEQSSQRHPGTLLLPLPLNGGLFAIMDTAYKSWGVYGAILSAFGSLRSRLTFTDCRARQ
jgi:hypothetical protein